MSADVFLADLLTYTLQTCFVFLVGLLLPRVFRFDSPKGCLRYRYSLLGLGLIGPLLLPLLPSRSVEVTIAGAAWTETVTTLGTTASKAPVAGLVLSVLVAGALCRLFWVAACLRDLKRLVREAHPHPIDCPPGLSIRSIDTTKIRAFLSDRAPSPLTFGFRRPVIVLPSTFAQLSSDEREAVLCHELLHVARRDWLAVLAEEALRVVFWWNPLLFMVLNRIALNREQVVDREVVAITDRRGVYLKALVEVARSASRARIQLVPGMYQGSELDVRVRTLLEENRMSRPRIITSYLSMMGLLVMATAIAAAALPLAGGSIQEPEGEAPPIDVTDGVVPPMRLEGPQPEYTEIAREARIQGTVIVEAVIDKRGDVAQVKVVKGLPMGLSEAATAAVEQWKFEPATVDGEPVSVYFQVTVNFRLEKDGEAEAANGNR